MNKKWIKIEENELLDVAEIQATTCKTSVKRPCDVESTPDMKIEELPSFKWKGKMVFRSF